jgi:DNA-binding NtrC family response regulator
VEILVGPAESIDEAYSLDGLEQQTICRVLAQTGGHQQKAADLLGISRRTLIRKLKLYRSPNGALNKLSANKLGTQPIGTNRDAARIVA